MAFNFFGISIPQISLPKISLPSLPKFTFPSLPSIPRISLPKFSLPPISLPAGVRAGTKAAMRYAQEQADRARWAAEAAAEAAGTVGRVAVTLPKVSLPKVTLPDLPKVTLPKMDLAGAARAISLPAAAGAAAISAVQRGELPKIDLPKISLPDLPKVTLPDLSNVPGLGFVSTAGAAAISAVQRGELPKIDLPKISLPGGSWSGSGDMAGRIITPEEAARSGIPTGGVSKPGGVSLAPREGGNLIDVAIGARNKSYEVGLEQAFTGNVAGGGAQFGATMAADVILPLDLIDAGNLWMTGRGDQIDGEIMLGAAIDGIGLLGSVFTFGGSYAASRALKAGMKTAKVGGKMGKFSGISKLVGRLGTAGRTVGRTAKAANAKALSAIRPLRKTTKAANAGGDVSAAMRKQAEAARKAYAKQAEAMQKAYAKQARTVQESISKAVKGVNPAETSKAANVLGKTGNTLKAAGLGLGVGAIGLTALGALGGPGPQEVPPEVPPGGGDPYNPYAGDWFSGTPPYVDPYGGEEPWWTLPDLPGFDFPETPGYDPMDPGNYPPGEYYPPVYPDPLGFEPYAQDFVSYGEDLPGIGPLLTAAKENGLALPALIGAVVLVVLVVAFLRSKKGKKMISGVKKQVSGAVSAGKKAVGA